MGDRYTKKDAMRCAKSFASVIGKKQVGDCWKVVNGKNVAKIGCWEVDYNPIYGGAIITEIHNAGGGITHPLGEGRLRPFEFCRSLQIAERAIGIDRSKKKK